MPTKEVTVHVPEERLPEFYSRFGDFMIERPTPHSPVTTLHRIGDAPDWIHEPGAAERAAKFWHLVTDAGRDLLRVLIDGSYDGTAREFTPTDLVDATGAKSAQSVAGTFGGIGQLIAAEGLPTYEYRPGRTWHFVWDWDPKRKLYSMAPEMAQLLRQVGA